MTSALDELCDEYWEALCTAHPISASYLGYREFDERVPDLSMAGEAAHAASFRDLARRAEAMEGETLDAREHVTLSLLRGEAARAADALAEAPAEYTVTPATTGPLVDVFETCPRMAVTESRHASAMVIRYRRLARFFDQAVQRLIAGANAGRTPVAHTTRATLAWLDAYLSRGLMDDPLLAPDPPADWPARRVEAWREAMTYVVERSIRPALQRYRDHLANAVLPHARSDEHPGLCWIPGGEDLYASAIRRHTTLQETPEELHRFGLAEVERLDEEYRNLGRRVFGTGGLPAIYARLRDDPDLRFDTAQSLLDVAEAALARAEAEVPNWFGHLPKTPCVVLPMDAHEVEHGTIAYYQPPAHDGSRPGTYYVNTFEPRSRTRFEAEALAFHEAVPGHHTQVALSQELDLPSFRRFALINAYVEGWALYTERLADEMGLYSGDLARFGMLAFDSWRACRLVVDTGLHHFGWSRSQAVRYLLDNSPLAENNIANEVDRYIVLPAQALSYKVGQRRFLELRERAERQLHGRFDLAAFHDAVLGQGPVSLDILGEQVDRWITSRAT